MNNNIFVILGLDTTAINLFPQSIIEEILQNVAVLINYRDWHCSPRP